MKNYFSRRPLNLVEGRGCFCFFFIYLFHKAMHMMLNFGIHFVYFCCVFSTKLKLIRRKRTFTRNGNYNGFFVKLWEQDDEVVSFFIRNDFP